MSGLDDLTAQRQKATKRSMPPPKTPARSTPVKLPEPEPVPVVSEMGETRGTDVTPLKPHGRASSPAKRAGAEPVVEDLARYSIYLDTTLDDYLSEVLNAGRKRRPRLAVSRSAVVRLALSELASRMKPEVAASEIAARAPVADGTTGRKRL